MDKQKFGNFLLNHYAQWAAKAAARGEGRKSQNDFCAWLGVPPTSFSSWVGGVRPPQGENVYKLAEKLGPEVYDLLDMPRMMPKNKKLNWLVSVWNSLPDSLQNEFLERAKNATGDKSGDPNGETATT